MKTKTRVFVNWPALYTTFCLGQQCDRIEYPNKLSANLATLLNLNETRIRYILSHDNRDMPAHRN